MSRVWRKALAVAGVLLALPFALLAAFAVARSVGGGGDPLDLAIAGAAAISSAGLAALAVREALK